jgi:hypothetical protein
LNFSRWMDAQPCPPSPPVACSTTRSTNVATAYLLDESSNDEGTHRIPVRPFA